MKIPFKYVINDMYLIMTSQLYIDEGVDDTLFVYIGMQVSVSFVHRLYNSPNSYNHFTGKLILNATLRQILSAYAHKKSYLIR